MLATDLSMTYVSAHEENTFLNKLRRMFFIHLKSHLLIIIGISLVPYSGNWHAEEEEMELIAFKDPKIIKRPKILYPKRALSNSEEGWVRLQAMIDLDGKPFDIVVTDSVGNRAFEGAAIQALRRSRFEPGEVNGEKVESRYWWQVTFEMASKDALYHSSFRQRFFNVVNAVAENEKSIAEKGLEGLSERRKTLHEDAMYWTAKYYFDQQWGTPSQQLRSVSRALGYDENRRFMDENLYRKLLWSKFSLQVDRRRYADALDTLSTFETLEGVEDSMRIQAQEYKNAINELSASEKVFTVAAVLGENGRWYYTPLRNSFGVTDVEGSVDEFTLYCQRNRFRFKFEPDFEYNVDGTNGTCNVAVAGEPGTNFTFVQL